VRISGIWRDYARQAGAIAIDATDYQGLTGDTRVNDLALWLKPGSSAAEVETALRRIAGPDLALEAASTASLRTLSMRIFDRSFAVTFYLQAVAIAVGLVGVAASLSAQVLARRKEFGLLAHLGLTRSQVIALVGLEAAAWLAAGTLIGLALGLAMAVVLVQVVNPQSFHWTMPLQVPWDRLAALAGAVLVAGILTALWSARRAAGHSAVIAVKEDW
jgi:putative ABC transport system permease protein